MVQLKRAAVTAAASIAVVVSASAAGAAETLTSPRGAGQTLTTIGGTVGAAGDAGLTVATTTSLPDPSYDTPSGVADILVAAADYQDDVIVVGVRTRLPVDPWAMWSYGDGMFVEFDVDGDDAADYLVVATGHDTDAVVQGGVFSSNETLVCNGSQLGFEWDESYLLELPAACVGDPGSLRWRVHQYDGAAEDVIPDDGWGPLTVETSSAPAPPPTHPGGPTGYWMLSRTGTVYGFGSALGLGNLPAGAGPAADLEPTPSGDGYWIATEHGSVVGFGDAVAAGSVPATTLRAGERVTAISATASGHGYWLFTSLGRVFAFGDAVHYGDMASVTLNGPIVGSTVTPSGHGYWMVGADGGIFTFGDAAFSGSTGNLSLNQPIVGLASDDDGNGYRLVGADGGIFAFDASFRGSMGGTSLNRPVIGAVAFGDGYLMVGADGGIFAFADEEFFGSLGSNPPSSPIVAVAVRS
jgi:hypothetical protein